jgi:hypothetical protein
MGKESHAKIRAEVFLVLSRSQTPFGNALEAAPPLRQWVLAKTSKLPAIELPEQQRSQMEFGNEKKRKLLHMI